MGYEEWLEQLEGEELCEVCRYQDEQGQCGIYGGPNGPVYPPCSDGDTDAIVNEAWAKKKYEEYLTETEEN